MAEDQTVYSLEEFHLFPWDRLGDALFWRERVPVEEQNECWQCGGVGRGGMCAGVDFNPNAPFIEFLKDNPDSPINLTVERWTIPESLADLVDEYHERGEEHARQLIRDALDIRKA